MIRPVRADELHTLRSVARSTFIETFTEGNRASDVEAYVARAFSEAAIQAEYSEPNSSFYFAMINDDVGGYLKLNVGDAQTEDLLEDALEIERIYVRSEMQGQRLGKALFEFSVQEAERRGCRWLWLGVWENNLKAIEFYQKQGLEVFDEHKFLFGNTPQRDHLMRKPL